MATVQMNTEFLADVVNYVEKTAQIQEEEAPETQEASAEAKATLEILKTSGLCDPAATDEQLLSKLANHAESLRTMGRLAKMVPPPSMGEPGNVKEASGSDPDMKESDRVFLTSLGLD